MDRTRYDYIIVGGGSAIFLFRLLLFVFALALEDGQKVAFVGNDAVG